MTIRESDSSVWLGVANVEDIPLGTMKHAEVNDREIVIANVNGKFYAIDDRCGHASAASLVEASEGTLSRVHCMGHSLT